MRTTRLSQVCGRVACGAILGAGVLLTAGCYERVVGASGPGAGQYKVQERYQEDSWLDRQVYGEEAKPGTRKKPE